jgi:hypothetical protein
MNSNVTPLAPVRVTDEMVWETTVGRWYGCSLPDRSVGHPYSFGVG